MKKFSVQKKSYAAWTAFIIAFGCYKSKYTKDNCYNTEKYKDIENNHSY